MKSYTYLAIVCLCALALLAAGCTTAPRAYTILDNAGHPIVVHVDYKDTPCATGATACTQGHSAVYISSAATWADDHELYWHGVNKGSHDAWVSVDKTHTCALVTDAGTNKGWAKGDIMCAERVLDMQGNPVDTRIVKLQPDTNLLRSAQLSLGVKS